MIRQGANLDITFVPTECAYLSQEFLSAYSVGDEIRISSDRTQATVDHYSAHSRTGQRHVRTSDSAYAVEPQQGLPFQSVTRPIPLLTYVAVAAPFAEEEPKGKWFGYDLNDENYGIFDIYAIPKGVSFQFNLSARIVNTQTSVESLDYKTIEFENCLVVVFLRTSTHNRTNLGSNLLFQQKEGRTAAILRVLEDEVLVQIADLRINVDPPPPS